MIELTQPNGDRVPGVLNEQYREPRASWIVTADGWGMPERWRRGRFALGSACLRDGVHMSFERRENDPAWCAGGRYVWMPEYAVTPAGVADPKRLAKGWLGNPKTPAVLDTVNGGTLATRYFEHGIVLVNASPGPISYRSSELLRTIGLTQLAAPKRAFVVPARDSLFLVRT